MEYTIKYCGNKLNDSHKSILINKHYLHTWRSLMQEAIFELRTPDKKKLIGLAVFGKPSGRNVLKKYGNETIELRRLVLSKKVEKNTLSWFLAKCLKYLRIHTEYTGVISYADPNVGHTGAIYKATNFKYLGQEVTPNPRVIIDQDGTRIGMRQLYQKSKLTGDYVKSAKEYQARVKNGDLKVIKQLKKERFFYQIKEENGNKNKIQGI